MKVEMEGCAPAPSRSRGTGNPGVAPAGVLTLLRHGESEWNRDHLFTGWADVGLSEAGVAEAERAGRLLARGGRPFDCCFTSVLRRAVLTSEIVLREMGQTGLPVESSWRLNERHYGALQGLGIWSALRRYGPLAVLRCYGEFQVRPPALSPGDSRFPGLDPRYGSLAAEELPYGESIADTQARLLPYWRERIVPELVRGRHVLVVSHKHTLLALLRFLRSRAPRDVPRLAVATGSPIVMTFDVRDHWILGHEQGADGGFAGEWNEG